MPGMPIFQDSPSQLKGQIYVLNSTEDQVLPLKLDSTANLPVAVADGATVGLAEGTTVGITAGTTVGLAEGTTVGITDGATVGLTEGTTVGLASDQTLANVTTVGTVTNDVKIVNGTTDLDVGLRTGTTVGLTEGTTVGITEGTTIGLATGATVGLTAGSVVQNQLVFTNIDSFDSGTAALTPKTIIDATNSLPQDISLESSYNWFIKNTGTAANQNIKLTVQISPDQTNWLDDTGSTITVTFDQSKMITVTNFLKWVRFVIQAPTAATTVISCFQAQH
jgi:hypothetical protein